MCSADNALYDDSAVTAYIVTGTVTFTAKYVESAKATVIFDYAGGTDGTAGYKVLSGIPGSSYMTAIPSPTKEGYTLSGWDSIPFGIFGTAGSITTYTAQWTVESFAVTFEAGTNGTMSPSTYEETVLYGDFVTSVPTITANSKYTFVGWSLNGGTTYYSYKSKTTSSGSSSSSNSYTVSYDANGGTGSYKHSSLSSGTTYTIASQTESGISYEGYTFIGWNT